MSMNIFVNVDEIDFKNSGIVTMRDLKKALDESNYDIPSSKLILSNGKLVAPEVFQTTKYDDLVIISMLDGSSISVYPKNRAPRVNNIPDILPTEIEKPLTPTNKIGDKTYYVVVDTGYEGHGEIGMQGKPVQPESLDLIALNHKSTDPIYNSTVKFLNDVIPKNMKIKYQRQYTNHPIFRTKDINSVTINNIINAARQMEYCEIWGNSHTIEQYSVSPDITLVHLKLDDVEAG
jgi:hypothetical protein